MKKVVALFMVLVLISSMSINALAASGNSIKGDGKGSEKNTQEETSTEQVKQKLDTQKTFKTELNVQKKEVSLQRNILSEEKELLIAQYDELLANGNTADAEVLMTSINDLKVQMDVLQNEMKQLINERFMIVKTLYSEEKLAEFDNAAAVIKQMYEDAYTLGAGSITIKNSIIKFDTPPYLKGGITLVPVRAITEELGAEVTWNEDTQTVNIAKDNIVIEMTINSTTVLINGIVVDMGIAPEVTSGRTYVPLRFLAETFELAVAWDQETETIDIEVVEGVIEEVAVEVTPNVPEEVTEVDNTDETNAD